MEKLFFETLQLACERYDVPFELGDDEIIELKEKFNECIKEFQILYESEGELQKVMFEFAEQFILGNENPQIIPDLSLKAPIQAIDSSMSVLIEQHLKDGKFDMAKQELKEIVEQTGDTRSRVAYYRLLSYLDGNSDRNQNSIEHHVLLAAQRGHICSMNLIFELLGFDWTIDTRYWRRLSDILDPMDNLKYDLDHFKNISVVDVIDALHEPDSHYYIAEDSEKRAIKYGLKVPATLHHDESTIICDDAVEEVLLNKAQAYLKKRDKISAEKLYDKLETINPAHGVFVKSLIYHSFLEYDKFFDNVKKGAELGIVAHMYVLSSIYRSGFGGAPKSLELADAWFWMATQCDNDECRGLDTVFDFDFIPLEFFLVGWKFYFDNPSFQWNSIIKGEKPDVQ
jgi:tetratricopeptide (TPR) repeat protein